MAKKNVGAALNAMPDDEDTPLRSIMSGAGDALLGDENSRRALLQIGLQMMQPVAMGQSVAGHIGQSIGAGGEATGRIEEQELKRTKQEDEIDRANQLLALKERETGAYEKGLTLNSLIQKQSARAAETAEKQRGREELLKTKNFSSSANEIWNSMRKIEYDPKAHPEDDRFRGKNPSEIEDMLRSDAVGRAGGVTAPGAKSRDDEAREWARANPSDPRAAEIRRRLGM